MAVESVQIFIIDATADLTWFARTFLAFFKVIEGYYPYTVRTHIEIYEFSNFVERCA